eukprot:g7437.t1
MIKTVNERVVNLLFIECMFACAAVEMQSFFTRPSDDQDQSYFTRIAKSVSKKVEVKKHDDSRKGRGLFATMNIHKGETILIEKPLISMQDSDNKRDALVCSHCLKHAGRLEDQLYWYLLNHTTDDDPLDQQLRSQFEAKAVYLPRFGTLEECELIYCDCGAVYCSEQCKMEAHDTYHNLLCSENPFQSLLDSLMYLTHVSRDDIVVNQEALNTFEDFCEQTNPNFNLIAKAICKMLTQLDHSSESKASSISSQNLELVWEPYWHAWRPLWWNCMTLSDASDSEKEAFQTTLKELTNDASNLLKEAIRVSMECPLFDPEFIGSLMGMISQNNISIELWSPLDAYIDQLNSADDSITDKLWSAYPKLKETIVEAAQYSVQGSGYYPIACCANHSCTPNAHSQKEDSISNNHVLILEATRDIQAGEEITISYIDEEADYEDRLLALNDYGFQCTCPKCSDVGLAFGLVIMAAASTVIGAAFALCTRMADPRTMAAALGGSTGVMIYVSFVEIFLVKSVDGFTDAGYSDDLSMTYSTLLFFAGIVFTAVLNSTVNVVLHRSYHDNDTTSHPIVTDVKTNSTGAIHEERNTVDLELSETQHDIETPCPEHESHKVQDPPIHDPIHDVYHLKKVGLMSALAVGLHNFPEGLATFVGTLADPTAGVAIAVATALHNFPEGVVIAMPLYYASKSRVKAIFWASVCGIFEFIGGVFGWLILSNLGDLAYAIMFAIVAGMMVYISIRDLIPTAFRFDPEDKLVTISVLIGMAVMATSLLMFTI